MRNWLGINSIDVVILDYANKNKIIFMYLMKTEDSQLVRVSWNSVKQNLSTFVSQLYFD